MFVKYHGLDKVEAGAYFNIKTGELVSVLEAGGQLSGPTEISYVKAPVLLLMILGPLLGLAFILFLPAAGMVILANFSISLAKHKTVQGIAVARGTAIQIAAPRRRPGVSFLYEPGNGGAVATEPGGRHKAVGEVHSLMEQLEREINQRRSLGEK